MAMTPREYLAWLEAAIERASRGAPAMADAMARHIAERAAQDTLTRTRLAPGTYHKARPGAPPAMMSGTLAKNMFTEPASAGLRSSAIVGNRDKRARLFEYGGCVLTPAGKDPMKWHDTGGWWSHRRLPLTGEFPEHPFLRPTVEDVIADGSLTRVAIDAFRPYDP
jgi:hypothetical protein